MSVLLKPLVEINQEAIRVLTREIGVANTLRFINQFNAGTGNYTEERREMYSGMEIDDLVSEIQRRRKS
jgi:hypothetical protein